MPKKEIQGTVVSTKMQKTIVVAVAVQEPHEKYGKYRSQTKKFKAHDELEESREGDFVSIIECRPFSKEKTWTLKSVLQKSQEI